MKISEAKKTVINILKIIKWKLNKQKILVINEASGLGDYLWVRNYLPLIKKQTDYKVIFCVTARWLDFAEKMDNKYIDIFVDFKDPANPKSKLIFKLFKFDIFIDTRKEYPIYKQISSKTKISGFKKLYSFGMLRNRELFDKIIDIPESFQYSLEKNLIPSIRVNTPYVILALGGISEGKFSNNQITAIFNKFIENKINILALGMKSDNENFIKILNKLKNNSYIFNGCGCFESFELPYLIDNSEFIITPNTSIYQMALLLNKKTILVEKKNYNLAANYKVPFNIHITPKHDLKDLREVSLNIILSSIDLMLKDYMTKNDLRALPKMILP